MAFSKKYKPTPEERAAERIANQQPFTTPAEPGFFAGAHPRTYVPWDKVTSYRTGTRNGEYLIIVETTQGEACEQQVGQSSRDLERWMNILQTWHKEWLIYLATISTK